MSEPHRDSCRRRAHPCEGTRDALSFETGALGHVKAPRIGILREAKRRAGHSRLGDDPHKAAIDGELREYAPTSIRIQSAP
jgi:hypothetical protein